VGALLILEGRGGPPASSYASRAGIMTIGFPANSMRLCTENGKDGSVRRLRLTDEGPPIRSIRGKAPPKKVDS
jgi:hypothetical protein